MEGWASTDAAGRAERKKQVRTSFTSRWAASADRFGEQLRTRSGRERGDAVKHAEAFAVCEYGRRRIVRS